MRGEASAGLTARETNPRTIRSWLAGIGIGLLLLVAVWPAATVHAQTPMSAPAPASDADALSQLESAGQPISPETVRDLVARLSDAQVRELLLQRLDATAAAASVPGAAGGLDVATLVGEVQDDAHRIRDRIRGIAAAVGELPSVFPRALETLRDGRPPRLFILLVLFFGLMMVVGWLAEWLFNFAARGPRRSIANAVPESEVGRLGYLLARLGLDVVGLVVFVVAAEVTFFVFYQGHELTRITVMTYVAAIATVRAFMLFSRFTLAPHAPALRLAYMDDAVARYLHRQNVIIAGIAAFGFFTCSLINHMGISGDVHELMVNLVFLVMMATIAYTVWHARAGVAGDIRGGGETVSRGRQVFANIWPLVILAFLLVFYLVIVLVSLAGFDPGYVAGFGTLLTFIFLPHIDAMIERAASSEQGEILAVFLRAVRIALIIAVVLFLAKAWGLSLFSLAEQGAGTRIADALIDIGFTVLVAYVLWQIARIMIDRRIEAEGGEATEAEMGEMGGTGGSRLGTLLPLIRRVVQVTIVVMAIMLVLSALGVNIGPLLAGAGVVGIAIGFGAQTLVRDIVSGLFFLMDDAFRVGEYIDVGAVKGTVEKISVRSLRLRHHRGALHTIPFGEITHLTNYSRDWVVMKLEFRVPFETDIMKVKKIFKQIGRELMENPEIGEDFLAPFKSQGVFAVDDSALVIRAKFTAKPGKQFLIRREAFSAVQKAFADNDIPFARKQVLVHVPEADEMSPEQRQQIERAAASTIEEEEKKAGQPAAAAGGAMP